MGSDKTEEDYEVLHQIVSISSVNFTRKSISGFTELTIRPLSDIITFVSLNTQQTRIYNVTVDDIQDVKFTHDDPFHQICGDPSKRKLDYFLTKYQIAILKNDYDYKNQGELKIEVPKEIQAKLASPNTSRPNVKVRVEFSIEDPICGIHFYIPDGTDGIKKAHLYTSQFANSARYCFPCIDSASARCHWQLEFSVNSELTVVSSGELKEYSLSSDEKHKNYVFNLAIPTAATGIGFAIGNFDVIAEPTKNNVAYFCPKGLVPLLQHTVEFLQRVYPIYVDYMNMSLPFGDYKIVFVDELLSDYQSYASLTTASINLLHSARIIDQTLHTRRALGMAIASQYFGVFIVPESYNDTWLVVGIKNILFLLFMRKIFGNNECRFWVYQQMMRVYEAECEQLLPPLHLKDKSQSYPLTSGNNAQIFHMDPMLTPPHILELMELKSMLVMRIVENRLGNKELIQNVIKKLLSLAWINPSGESSSINALLSTQDFLKTIQVVSGKDLSDFMSRYVYQPGFCTLNFSFAFNRKRNVADVTIKQKTLHDCEKYVGQLTVLVQELDGSFSNLLQVEKTDVLQELNCQSKSRRNKKKKIPLFTGEEVDIDLSHSDQDSPVIWLRVDPEMLWLSKTSIEMPDYMWQAMLLHERDVVYQHIAAEVLPNFPSQATINTLSTVLLDDKCYYQVRKQALHSLAKCISISGDPTVNEEVLINLYRKLYGSVDNEKFTRMNDFSDFPLYFIQQEFMRAIGRIKDHADYTTPRIVQFLYQQLYYNDNQRNEFDDSSMIVAIIDGLTYTVPHKVDYKMEQVLKHVKQVLPKIVCYLNIDKKMPSYQQIVSAACLRFISKLIQYGHIMDNLKDSSIFSAHLKRGQSFHVRCTAIQLLALFIKNESSERDLNTILSLIEFDQSPFIRCYAAQQLYKLPLFTKHQDCFLNNLHLVERLWRLLNEHQDFNLRCCLAQLYYTLYGRTTPTCVPTNNCAVVIDLKGQTARTNVPGIPSSFRFSSKFDDDRKYSSDDSSSSRKRKKHKPLS
ncbi:hypothetical protein ACHWQZ_G003840 [Mnemiopsis leidyi]